MAIGTVISEERSAASLASNCFSGSETKGITMPNSDKDQSILAHINQLVEEEEQLYRSSELAAEDQARLAKLKVELDQCWDLLRQRRALREFGQDPDKAKVRAPSIVENYEQ
jgi:hypothetical protein